MPSLNQKVIVISKPDSRGEVQVQAGIMKINVKVADLRKSKVTEEDKKKAKINKRELKLNLRSVSTSVDLRGMDAEEAIYTVDKYLDEAFLGGLKRNYNYPWKRHRGIKEYYYRYAKETWPC